MRQDGQAIDVTAPADVTKDTPVYAEGFAGIAMADALSGESVALEISDRVFELNVGGVSAPKGAILYIHDDSSVDVTSSDGVAFAKVTVAKDSNNIVWAKLLPQGAPLA